MTKQLLPSLHLDTGNLPEGLRLAAWANTIPAYEVRQHDERSVFSVRAEAWLVGAMVVSATEVTAIRMTRSVERLRADGLDHISIVLNQAASWMCEIDGHAVEVPAGVICVLDNAQPFTTISHQASFVIAVLPRSLVQDELPRAMHGCQLRGTLGSLFADYLGALVRRLPVLDADDAPAVLQATRDLLLGCFNALSRASLARLQDANPLSAARRFVDRNLGAQLTVLQLARELGFSRSALYRAFAPVGGVERFILSRRLAWAHAALLDPSEHKTIAVIAHESGFASAAHFARSFKKAYSVTPRSLRNSRTLPRAPQRQPEIAAAYRTWTGVPAAIALNPPEA